MTTPPTRASALNWFTVRPALAGDYAAFARLFPELGIDDPLPSPEAWTSTIAPCSWMAEAENQVVGYAYVQEYKDTGYIRNVIVAPQARRRGVGRALMNVLAERLRDHGKKDWRLNVRPYNHAALALYVQMGMEVQYPRTVLRLPWTALGAVPAGSAVVRELPPERDGPVEARFDLPSGQLAYARGNGRLVLEAVRGLDDQELAGVTVFNQDFVSLFPFRVVDTAAVGPLLRATRVLAPDREFVTVVADDDARLVALLTGAGAVIKDEMLHLRGSL